MFIIIEGKHIETQVFFLLNSFDIISVIIFLNIFYFKIH